MELGTTAAFTKSMMESTKGLGKRDGKGSTRDFLFGSWFASKRLVETAMEVGSDIICYS